MDIFALLPLLSAICVFCIGLFVFLREKKSGIHFTFFLHSISITVWLFGTFMMFMNRGDRELAIYWDRFVYIGVVFIPAFMYHFFLSYAKKQRDFLFYLGYVLSAFFLLLSRTVYFVDDLFIYKWGVHTRAQILHHFFLLYFSSYVVLWFVKTYEYYKKLESPILKQQTKYIFTAFFVLIPIGSLGYLPAYGIPIFPFGYLGGVVFTVILAYAVLKHQLFNMKVIATEVLSVSLSLVLFIQFILSESFKQYLLNGILTLVSMFFGILLIRSVYAEVESREETEHLADKLKQANKKLEKLSEAKSEFVTIASHQLRAPLTAIKGYASMLVEGSYGRCDQEAQEPLKRIYQSSHRLVLLIDEFLNLSRIERGKIEYDLREADVGEIVTNVFNEFCAINSESVKKLNLDLNIEKGKFFIATVDANKIRQVVSNLIDNAMKYTSKGFVKVGLSNHDGKKIIFSVKDSGMGMSKDTVNKIFEKFTRAGSDSFHMHTEGLGLGLYVCKHIMKAHNGKIWAESKGEGKGSSFYFEIPIVKNVNK